MVNQRGDTLLEVMISIFLISIILLGFNSSQWIALHVLAKSYNEIFVAQQQQNQIEENIARN